MELEYGCSAFLWGLTRFKHWWSIREIRYQWERLCVCGAAADMLHITVSQTFTERKLVTGSNIQHWAVCTKMERLNNNTPLQTSEGLKNIIFQLCYQNIIVLFCVDSIFNAFLGECAKLQKVTRNFVMSVLPSICPSVCMEQLGSHWMEFHEIFSCHRPECLYGYMKEIP